jgi:hypothetical protein
VFRNGSLYEFDVFPGNAPGLFGATFADSGIKLAVLVNQALAGFRLL